MYLYLLEVSVNLDLTRFENLIIVVSAALVLFFYILFHGINLKFGDKEVNVGGQHRMTAKKDKDVILKEELKKISDDVDGETMANLYDVVEDMEDHLDYPLIKGEHCYFSYEKFSSIVRSELYRRIRRNNLWEKISDAGRDGYVAAIMRDIKTRYEALQSKAISVKCGDAYADFAVIKDEIRNILNIFLDRTLEILIASMKKKIKTYEAYKELFQTAAAKKICCDDRIVKNQTRIDILSGLLGRA